MKKVIITGATGMIGGLVLRHCLSSDYVKEVVSISRRSCGISHPKLREIIESDFLQINQHPNEFEDVDLAYFCLGAYTGSVPDNLFKTITVDYATSFADLLKSKSPQAHLSFLSGAGADNTEKSRTAFARYKGMAENHLINLNLASLAIFRPGYIYPNTPRKEPNIMYSISRLLYPLIKRLGSQLSIESESLAKAMFMAGFNTPPKTTLENRDILQYLKDHV